MRNYEAIEKLKKEIAGPMGGDNERARKQRELELLLEEAIAAELSSIASQLQTIASYLSKS